MSQETLISAFSLINTDHLTYPNGTVVFEKNIAGTHTFNVEHAGDFEVTVVGAGAGGAYFSDIKYNVTGQEPRTTGFFMQDGGSGDYRKYRVSLPQGLCTCVIGAAGNSVTGSMNENYRSSYSGRQYGYEGEATYLKNPADPSQYLAYAQGGESFLAKPTGSRIHGDPSVLSTRIEENYGKQGTVASAHVNVIQWWPTSGNGAYQRPSESDFRYGHYSVYEGHGAGAYYFSGSMIPGTPGYFKLVAL